MGTLEAGELGAEAERLESGGWRLGARRRWKKELELF